MVRWRRQDDSGSKKVFNVRKHEMHFIPKRNDEIAVVESIKTMCSMIVKNIKVDWMVHERDDFEVEVDLKVLAEKPMDYQERDCLVEKMVSFLKKEARMDGDGNEDFAIGEGVRVSSSSWVKSTKSFLGGMMLRILVWRVKRFYMVCSSFGRFENTCGISFDKELTKRVGEGVLARERKRKRKWKDGLFSFHNPFLSFAHSEEREEA
nr:hypothetical protein [Tanacetum cinerariifolium]